VELLEPLGFIIDVSACSFRKRLERLDLDTAALVAPGSRDRAIDQERLDGMRRLGVEDQRPVTLRQDLRAPGVEDARTWDLLRLLGCDLAQGYFISRPMLAGQVLTWLSQWEKAPGQSANKAA
jgi:hypothetical protein